LIAPLGAGVMSAVGFLGAPLAFDFVRSAPSPLAAVDWARVNGLFAEMEAEGRSVLAAAGVAAGEVRHARSAEMRYVGQGHEIAVDLPGGRLGPEALPMLQGRFEEEYRRLYGRLGPPVAVEAISWRVVSSGPRPTARLVAGDGGDHSQSADVDAARKGTRPAWFPETEGTVETPIYDRYRLGQGATFVGPAIVEERESTLIVGPGARCAVDEQRNLVVSLSAGGAE
jgi:N-methylhydantoinase A